MKNTVRVFVVTFLMLILFCLPAYAMNITLQEGTGITVDEDPAEGDLIITMSLKTVPSALVFQIYDGDTLVAMKSYAGTDGQEVWCLRELSLKSGHAYTLKAADYAGGKWLTADFVTRSEEEEETAPEETAAAVTGTWGSPVENGTWSVDPAGNWFFNANGAFKETWGYITFDTASGKKTGWFYFDKKGCMLVGWQLIGGKWYYLNPVHDGTYGMCYLNTTTPDGYKVDANGAWIQ